MKLRDFGPQHLDDEVLLNVEEGAAFLRVSVPSVRLWERQGRLASHRLGKRVFFKVRDLKSFIEAGRRPARSEVVAASR